MSDEPSRGADVGAKDMFAAIEVESQSVPAYLLRVPSAPSDLYVRRVVEMILAETGS